MSELTRLTPARLRSAVTATAATGLAGQAALLVSGPLLARLLGADGRGQLAALVLWPTLVAHFGSLGLPSATTYLIAQGRASAKAVCRAVLPVALPQALILVGLHAALLALVLRGEPSAVRTAGLITLVAVPAHLAQLYGLAILQGRRRFALFNVQRLLPALLHAGGISALFAVGSESVVAVVLLWVCARVAVSLATLAVALGIGGPAPAAASKVDRKEMFQFGLRGLFGSISPVSHFRIDQVVLALFLAPEALGLYVTGLAFTNVLRFFSESVGMVAYPSVAAHADGAAGRRSMWSFVWLGTGASVAIVIPLLLTVRWLVPLLFGDQFRGAVLITEILLAGMVFASARRVLADGLKGRGHPGAGTLAEVTAWVWLAPALGALVPLWGVNGAAAALSSSYVVSLGALLLVAARQGEARLPVFLSSPPRAAWNRLRLISAPRLR